MHVHVLSMYLHKEFTCVWTCMYTYTHRDEYRAT